MLKRGYKQSDSDPRDINVRILFEKLNILKNKPIIKSNNE